MIVVRNVFQLKFGKAREAVALWKEGVDMMKSSGFDSAPRLLTDLVGPAYTLVLEGEFESLGAWQEKAASVMGSNEWKDWYSKFVPLVESGYREVFNVVS